MGILVFEFIFDVRIFMNQLIIMGHLGGDPETRFTPSGQKVTNFRVAQNQKRGGKDETLWWRVTVWGERFDKMISYLKKGKPVIAVGEMSMPEIYEREGNSRVSLSMTAYQLSFSPFGSGRNQEEKEGKPFQQGGSAPSEGVAPSAIDQQIDSGRGELAPKGMPDDEIPF